MVPDLAVQWAVSWGSSHFQSASFDNHREIHPVPLNISKAFDWVWCKGLQLKLPNFRFSPSFVLWTPSFSSRRTTSIRVDGALSQPFPVNSSIFRGSVLALILFLYWLMTFILYLQSSPLFCWQSHSPLFSFLPHSSPCEHQHWS